MKRWRYAVKVNATGKYLGDWDCRPGESRPRVGRFLKLSTGEVVKLLAREDSVNIGTLYVEAPRG